MNSATSSSAAAWKRVAVVGVPVALLAGVGWALWAARDSTPRLMGAAREASHLGDYEKVLELAPRMLASTPTASEPWLLAARAAEETGQTELMLDYCRRIPEGAGGEELAALFARAGHQAIRAGRASDAERFDRRALAIQPDLLDVHRRLAALYLGQARRWESAPHLFALLRGRAFTLEELAFLGNLEELYDAEQLMTFFERSVPEDLTPMVGRARLLLFKNFTEEGGALLERLAAAHPDLIEAQAQLGVVLVSQSRDRELIDWNGRLPAAAEEHPEVWWVRGTFARRQNDVPGAIRCAWEALRRDPNHLGATYQLAQLLAIVGRSEAADAFARRAARLEALAAAIHDILLRETSGEAMLRC
ncbi:MAG: hypothetical protein KF774_09430, partial [Planctomyces sp.]|nr:hypothetical protein [Planctomyces sp.]